MNIELCYNFELMFTREKFVKYIHDKKHEWNIDASWTNFTNYLEVTQQTMTAWKNGYLKRIPN